MSALATSPAPAVLSVRGATKRFGAVTALDAVDLVPGSHTPSALLTLDGPPSLDVALAMRDGIVYFNDEGPALSDRRARRARITWVP